MKDKKKSKRVPLKQKYSVEKKVRDHTRKLRKSIRKGSLNKKRYKKKDPGIPNNFPFKAQMLEEIRRQREKDVLEKAQKKAEEKEKRIKMANGLNDDEMECTVMQSEGDENNYEEIRKKAEKASSHYSDLLLHTGGVDNDSSHAGKQENATTAFYRSLRQVIEQSDVLIEVLDARDPQEYRNLNVERQIIGDGKKLILLLNKIDLVPKEVVQLWLDYLRKSFPVVAFKSALTTQSSRTITHATVPSHIISESELHVGSQVVGAPALIQLLKNYSRTGPTNTKLSITVGIIGVPNVGKSSVINSLCRSTTTVRVGGEAGITRRLQEIQLDAKIKLIDSPGVVMGFSESDSDMALRGAVKISSVKNPIEVVEVMLQRFPTDQIMKLFKIPFYANASDFLGHIARARAKLAKGGVPDLLAAAKLVVIEWTSGKIRHFCIPPKEHPAEREAQDAGFISGPRFVSKFSDAFDVDALLNH